LHFDITFYVITNAVKHLVTAAFCHLLYVYFIDIINEVTDAGFLVNCNVSTQHFLIYQLLEKSTFLFMLYIGYRKMCRCLRFMDTLSYQ